MTSNAVNFELVDIFPNASQGIRGIGFIFGAGASHQAGYPLLQGLTTSVFDRIGTETFELLSSLVKKSLNKDIDKSNGNPDIEIISDIIEESLFKLDRSDPIYGKLNAARSLIRDNIVAVFLSIKPQMDVHIRFFNALNRLFSGRAENVWIFTPNYDNLIEAAAAITKTIVFDGFMGTSLRYFDPQGLNFDIGQTNGKTFSALSKPIIRLVKLHGSLDCWRDGTGIYRTQESDRLHGDVNRAMVLPRRRKIAETLDSPFGEIFRVSANVIGTRCKYLVSCGYSYGDEHINEALFLPKVQQGKIRLTAFTKINTTFLDPFRNLGAFSFGTESSFKKNGILQKTGTDLWQFDKFVDLLCKSAGV